MDKFNFLRLLLAGLMLTSYHIPVSHTKDMSKSQRSRDILESEELRVYTTLLDGFDDWYGSNKLLIYKETTIGLVSPRNEPDDVIKFLRKRIPGGMATEIVDDFRDRNQLPIELNNKFTTKINYIMVGKRELSSDDWPEFYKQYPGRTIVELSRISFSQDKNQALVYISSQNGSLSGWAYYVFLTKHDDSWQIKHKIQAWVS